MVNVTYQSADLLLDFLCLVMTIIRHGSGGVALCRQPDVSIICSQAHSVLGSAREHAVRLRGTVRDQVVNHNPNVRILKRDQMRTQQSAENTREYYISAPTNRAVEDKRRSVHGFIARIDAGNDPLRRCLLISRRPVDLPGEVKP